MPDILLFGATGYTGRLTAKALSRRGADFAIAGRDRQKLRALASLTGDPEVRVASVGDVDALTAALSDVKVLVTCVGPFVELGSTAVDAALRAGTHYIDSTGEGTFIEGLIRARSGAAREAGIAMAPASGFDEVPADVAATLAVDGLEDAGLVLTYAFPSSGSRGTLRSALPIVTSEGRWIEDGRAVPIRAGERSRWSPMPPPLGPKPAVSFPLAEGHLAPLHLELRSLELYITIDPVLRAGLKVGLPLLRALSASPVAMSGVTRFFDLLPEGPSEQQRDAGHWTILAEARSRGGWRNVALTGTNVYGLTAEFLAAGALRMTEGDFTARGVVSPVQAMGIERWLKEFEDHKVTVQVYEEHKEAPWEQG
jgi:short subunit dehydrogenase-like uncharacterized protein